MGVGGCYCLQAWKGGGSGGVCSHSGACSLVWEHVVLDSTGSFPVVRLCHPDGFHPLTTVLVKRGTGPVGSAVLVRCGLRVILSACRWDV